MLYIMLYYIILYHFEYLTLYTQKKYRLTNEIHKT